MPALHWVLSYTVQGVCWECGPWHQKAYSLLSEKNMNVSDAKGRQKCTIALTKNQRVGRTVTGQWPTLTSAGSSPVSWALILTFHLPSISDQGQTYLNWWSPVSHTFLLRDEFHFATRSWSWLLGLLLAGSLGGLLFFFSPIQVLPARERTVSGRLGHIVFNLLHGHTLQLHLHQLSANEQGRDYCMEVVQSRATKKFVQEGQTTRSDFPLLTKEDPGRNRIPVSFT